MQGHQTLDRQSLSKHGYSYGITFIVVMVLLFLVGLFVLKLLEREREVKWREENGEKVRWWRREG